MVETAPLLPPHVLRVVPCEVNVDRAEHVDRVERVVAHARGAVHQQHPGANPRAESWPGQATRPDPQGAPPPRHARHATATCAPPMPIRWLALAGAALCLSACGGTILFEEDGAGGAGGRTFSSSNDASSTSTGTSTPPADLTPACAHHCDAVASAGCFDLDHCRAGCMALYGSGCDEQVEALLACLPEWLSGACQILYAEDPPYGCGTLFDEANYCNIAASACDMSGAEITGNVSCAGRGTCGAYDYEIACDDGARCTCKLGGELVGECAMPFAGAEACVLGVSCCRGFFAD
jgi:hypothetical protein